MCQKLCTVNTISLGPTSVLLETSMHPILYPKVSDTIATSACHAAPVLQEKGQEKGCPQHLQPKMSHSP